LHDGAGFAASLAVAERDPLFLIRAGDRSGREARSQRWVGAREGGDGRISSIRVIRAATRRGSPGACALHFGYDRYGGSVFSNLLQLISRRSPPSYDLEFVREVRVTRRAPRSAKSKRLMLAGWLLIALKCWLVVWAVGHYNVPVNPLWVTLPTVIFAGVCTLMYFLGE